jgi:hypothetical protein
MTDPETHTTINVKRVSVAAWEAAKAAAIRQGETMGAWLSRALATQAGMEAGPRELPPVARPAGNPELLPPEQLAGLLHGVAALAGSTGVSPAKADVRRAYRLADAMVREASGLPQRPVRARPAIEADGKASGKEVSIERIAGMKTARLTS